MNDASLFWAILGALYVYAPAGIANVAPLACKWLPHPTPISVRYLGGNKTWCGLALGVLAGICVACLQRLVSESDIISPWVPAGYHDTHPVLLGALLGGGAILGDAVKSFFKRRKGIQPGKPWKPWDQTDWVFGATVAVLVCMPFTMLHLVHLAVVLLLSAIAHDAVCVSAHTRGFKASPH